MGNFTDSGTLHFKGEVPSYLLFLGKERKHKIEPLVLEKVWGNEDE